MKLYKSYILCLSSLQCVSGQQASKNINVAIIGAGASGTSLSYYLSQLSEKNNVELNIDIFEKEDKIGGRVSSVKLYDKRYELGAGVFTKDNLLVMEAIKKFSLEIEENSKVGNAGFFDGDKIVEHYNGKRYLENIKFYWKYSIPYIATTLNCNKMKKQYENMYNITYNSIYEFGELSGLNLSIETNAYEYWLEHITTNENFIKIILNSIVRSIYSADVTQVHPLAACVAFLGATSKSYSVKKGNSKIFEEFINHSKAMIAFNSEVTKISYIDGLGYCLNVNGNPYYSTYDAVFIATPFHGNSFNAIKYENINYNLDIYKEVKYTAITNAIFENAKINPEYFNTKSNLDIIYTINKNLDFSVIAENKEDKTVEISQLKYIPFVQLREMLSSDQLIYPIKKHWDAYPNMTPIKNLEKRYYDIKHHENIYYMGSLEPLVSAMDSQMLNAKNIAKLAFKNWGFKA